MRLDAFLWFVRLSASRRYAQQLVTAGHLRMDGRPIAKPATPVRIGSVLTFATHRGEIRIVRIEAFPVQRCPASEAKLFYTDLNAQRVDDPPAET